MNHQIHNRLAFMVIVVIVNVAIACGCNNDQEAAQSEWCIRGLEQFDLRRSIAGWKSESESVIRGHSAVPLLVRNLSG